MYIYYPQLEVSELKQNKDSIQTTLEATRSALVMEQRKHGHQEKELSSAQLLCDSRQNEILVLSDNLKNLDKVKEANQLLVIQMNELKENHNDTEKKCQEKQEVSYILMYA